MSSTIILMREVRNGEMEHTLPSINFWITSTSILHEPVFTNSNTMPLSISNYISGDEVSTMDR